MAPNGSAPSIDRVGERRRAVALACHYREAEGLAIAQIADRLGRSPATIKAYFYDPTGEKARHVGVCRGCGVYAQPRNGKGAPTLAARRAAPRKGPRGLPGAKTASTYPQNTRNKECCWGPSAT